MAADKVTAVAILTSRGVVVKPSVAVLLLIAVSGCGTRASNSSESAKPNNDGTASEGLSSLQGEWRVVEHVMNGNASAENYFEKIVFDDAKMTTIYKESPRREEATILSVNPKTTPAELDLKGSEDGQEFASKGIYKLENGRLTICIGDERPKIFSGAKGSKTVLLVLERMKK